MKKEINLETWMGKIEMRLDEIEARLEVLEGYHSKKGAWPAVPKAKAGRGGLSGVPITRV